MRHLVDHRKLGRSTSHRKALLRNMVTSLILSERIETTLPKAKELRRVADEMITWAKEGTLHARRQAARVIQDPSALQKLFNGLGDRFKTQAGGYTRIYPLGFRRGDAAPMAMIEYLGYELPAPAKKEKDKKEDRKKKEKKINVEVKKEEKPAKKEAKQETKKEAKETKKETKKEEKKESKPKRGLFGRKKKEE